MEPRRSLRWPILLGVVLIGSIITLGVGWVLVSIAAAVGSTGRNENAAFYWAVLGVGIALLVVVLAGVIVYLALTVKAIALSQRQSNFIDSVTHELKSPLASLKLALQTLGRRPLPMDQQADFHRFMLPRSGSWSRVPPAACRSRGGVPTWRSCFATCSTMR